MLTIHLEPRGPLFVGTSLALDREATQDYIPSDTLFSAFVSAWALQGTLDTRLPACLGNSPALRLTSAFPRVGDTRLYPMPLGLTLNLGTASLTGKARKRVRWVSEAILQRMLNYAHLGNEADRATNFGQNGSVWMLRAELVAARALIGQSDDDLKLWDTNPRPRVSVGRANNAPNYFETARQTFGPGCGLWFMADGDTSVKAEDWVTDALAHLKDSGLGGLRSSGHGAFDFVSVASPKLNPTMKGSYAMLLSRFSPRDAAETDATLRAPGAAYALDTVGGWCVDDAGHAWRRKTVRLVREGSLVGAGAVGCARDVMPPGVMTRAVWRFGLAFALPVDPKAVMTP